MKTIENLTSTWLSEEKLVLTRLSGDVTIAEIEDWERGLHQSLDEIEYDGVFKMLVDLHGFKAANVEAHKRYRNVIPIALANHGWRIGYLDLFDEASDLQLAISRGVRCVGAAHVHQDASKIDQYQSMFGNDREQYFTDPVAAQKWIEQLPVNITQKIAPLTTSASNLSEMRSVNA